MANRRKPKYDPRQKRDIFQQLIDSKRTDIFIPARMGDKDKVVKGSKRGYVYCRLPNGQVLQVRNNKVAARPGRNVLLGYEPTRPGLLQVLAPRDSIVDDDMYDLPSHGDSHTWPEYDAAYIRDEQYLPLLAVPSGDWEVQIYRKVLLWPDQSAYVLIADQKVNLVAHKITSGAKWVLLQVDNTGVVTGKDGALVDSRQLLTEANIPLPDADHLAPHAVKFYAGQKKLQKSKRVNDFLDLRFGAYGGGGGTGTGDVLQDGTVVAGNLAAWSADHHVEDTGIAAAGVLTDAESIVGTFIGFGPELITNGGFDTNATGWNVGTGWAWEDDGAGGGWMRHTAGNTDPLSQDGTLVNNGYYYVQITVGGLTNGSVGIFLDDGSGQFNLASPSYLILRYYADAGVKIVIYPTSDFDGYIDAVSITRPPMVQEAALDNQIYGRGGFGWYPLVNAIASVQNFTVSNSPYTAIALKDCTVIWDASGGDCTQNLPAATRSGKIFYFKKIDSSANTVTITPDGTDTIDGAASFVLDTQWQSVTIQDGASGAWYIL